MFQSRGKSSTPAQTTQSSNVGAAQMKVTNPRQADNSEKSEASKSVVNGQAQPAQMFTLNPGAEGGPKRK